MRHVPGCQSQLADLLFGGGCRGAGLLWPSQLCPAHCCCRATDGSFMRRCSFTRAGIRGSQLNCIVQCVCFKMQTRLVQLCQLIGTSASGAAGLHIMAAGSWQLGWLIQCCTAGQDTPHIMSALRVPYMRPESTARMQSPGCTAPAGCSGCDYSPRMLYMSITSGLTCPIPREIGVGCCVAQSINV